MPTIDSSRLTARELDVLKLVAIGKANREIAAELYLGYSTVKVYITHIARKINVHTRGEIAAWAWQNGVMEGSYLVPHMAEEILRLCPNCRSPLQLASEYGDACDDHREMLKEVMKQLTQRSKSLDEV